MAWPQGRCQPRKQKKRFQWIPNRISTRKRNFSSVFPEFLSCECEKARLNPLTWFTLNGKAFSKDFLWTSIKASLFEKPVWCQKLTTPPFLHVAHVAAPPGSLGPRDCVLHWNGVGRVHFTPQSFGKFHRWHLGNVVWTFAHCGLFRNLEQD